MKEDTKNGFGAYWGTSQSDRQTKALMPENVRIDARELHDFLAFCARTARLIPNFDLNNQPAGTWADFLEKDPTVFLALLLDHRPNEWNDKLRDILRRYEFTNPERKTEAFYHLANTILEMAGLLDGWYKNSLNLLKWEQQLPFNAALEKAIESETGLHVRYLKDLLTDLEKSNLIPQRAGFLEQLAAFHPVWELNRDTKFWKDRHEGYEPCFLEGKKPEDRQAFAVKKLRQIFQQLHFTLNFLCEKAPKWFQDSLNHRENHDPQIGLLLAFLHLFLHARDQLNTFTRHHLHHYYFDWLRQKQRAAIPDRTIVCFELADNIRQFRLPKDTLLLADVNEAGLPSQYATTEETRLCNTKIAALRTVYVSKSDLMKSGSSYKLVSGIYTAPVANSRDGKGAAFGSADPSWPVFGEEQLDKNPGERQMTDASIGFVLAAPILALQEGKREIDLQCRFSERSFSILIDLIDDICQNTGKKPEEVVSRLFSNSLLIDASGETGWFAVENWKIDTPENWLKNSAITLTLYLHSDDPAIVDNVPGTLGETFDSPWPLLKITLNPNHNIYLYSFILPLELDTLRIETRVSGLKSLTVLNEVGLLDTSSPFLPFGALPNRNAYLLIGSKELFRKRLSDLQIHLEWNNLPELEGGFAEYYREYHNDIDNNSFQVRLSALSNGVFRPKEPAQRQDFSLFTAPDGPDKQLHPHTVINNIRLNHLQIQPDYSTQPLPEYSNSLRSGYLKVQLYQPQMAFGHADYPRLFTRAMIEQARTNSGFFSRGGETDKESPLLREPFTPEIEKLYIDYTAVAKLNLQPLQSEENDEAAREKIFVLHPGGQQEIFDAGKTYDRYLFPRFEDDGYLFIGLDGAIPGQAVSLLFHLRESKHASGHGRLNVRWSYMHANHWEPFSAEALLSDQTRQFTTTGIISLLLPDGINTDQTVMPPGLFWLRAAIGGNMDGVGRALDVRINAAEVVWVNNGDASHFDPAKTLPPVKELVFPAPEIAAVTQPVGFYGARPADRPGEFYIRTSERLRHKNRAINTWDLEHLVLERFPEIRRVKCIGWMQYNQLSPGQIKVVVVPRAPETELEPMLGFHQLELIAGYLRERLSPFVDLQVINPVYEKIKISCTILLEKGFEHDKGKCLQQLQDELRHFICPWLRSGEIRLGGHIGKNELLAFIKNRPYIRFVTRFSLIQIYEPDGAFFELRDTARDGMGAELLMASTPWSVLSPVDQHSIQFIEVQDHIQPEAAAIEGMRLGIDFIVLEGHEQPRDESGLKIHPEQPPGDSEPDWYLFPKQD